VARDLVPQSRLKGILTVYKAELYSGDAAGGGGSVIELEFYSSYFNLLGHIVVRHHPAFSVCSDDNRLCA